MRPDKRYLHGASGIPVICILFFDIAGTYLQDAAGDGFDYVKAYPL